MDVKLKWRKGFFKISNARFKLAQQYVDNECVKRMEPYVPVGRREFVNAGKLRDSVKIPEPGKIIYTAPFARHDYYADVNHALGGGNKKAQRMWFEYMKAESGRDILRGACAIVGGKTQK